MFQVAGPIIVADASGAFCRLGHGGAKKTDAMEPSCDAAVAPSTSITKSRRFMRSPCPHGPRASIVVRMASALAGSVCALARSLQALDYSTAAGGVPKGGYLLDEGPMARGKTIG